MRSLNLLYASMLGGSRTHLIASRCILLQKELQLSAHAKWSFPFPLSNRERGRPQQQVALKAGRTGFTGGSGFALPPSSDRLSGVDRQSKMVDRLGECA